MTNTKPVNQQTSKPAKKHCLWCGKKLINRNEKFCDRICKGKDLGQKVYPKMHATLGNTLWTKKKILKEFKKIRSEKKYSFKYMKNKQSKLLEAIKRHFGKKPWTTFLYEIGAKDKVIYNTKEPKYKKAATLLLKYWREELGYKLRQNFTHTRRDGIPNAKGKLREHGLYVFSALKYLKKEKVIRIIKRGRSQGHASYPTKYILLKTRI